jgi:hypothetical protein
MPVNLSWFLENRVMQIVAEGAYTDDELINLDPQVIKYLDQSTVPLVHMIMDRKGTDHIPSMKSVAQVKWPRHQRYGWTLVVGSSNPFQRFVVALANNFFKGRQRNFDSFDEALDFLNEVDSTLPPLRALKKQAAKV